jgi:hypothetical protein
MTPATKTDAEALDAILLLASDPVDVYDFDPGVSPG